MNRQQYYWARSLARHASRMTELLIDQDASQEEITRAKATEAWAISRVPGGLTRRWFYYGTCLLPEWCARRNKVRRQIQLRHCAERETARQMREVERMLSERAAKHYPSTMQVSP